MDTVVSSFESGVLEHDADVVKTTADELGPTLEEVVEEPAVGVPIDDVVDLDLESLSVDIDLDPTREDVDAAATGVTTARYGIAEYGSIVIDGNDTGNEPVSLYPNEHVAVVAESAILPDMRTAVNEIGEDQQDLPRNMIIATGPSATADMGELVLGAHGPRAVTVVVVTDR
ncbi:MAG: lactate utilization protein C [Halodesulfurarchaeum sp.]